MSLDETYDNLVAKARAAALHAHAPFSGFAVGAAIVADDGSIFTGCNVECSSYGGTICAERAALAAGVTNGYKVFTAIAVYTDTEEPTPPCGICRQLLHDFSADMTIVSACRSDRIKVHKASELLPEAFTPAHIERD